MYNGWVIKHYLSVSISPLDWDFKKQQARTNNRADLQDINTILLRAKTELDAIIRNERVSNLGKIPSKSEVQYIIHSSPTLSNKIDYNLVSKYFTHFIQISEKGKRSEEISHVTILIYKKTLDYVQKFETFHKTKLAFNDVTLDFYKSFISYLSNNYNLARNTIGKYIRLSLIHICLKLRTKRRWCI